MTEQEREKMRKKRRRARRRKKARKKILISIAVVIIVLAVFVCTVKAVNPYFDFAAYLPDGNVKQAAELVDAKLFGKTTTTKPASSQTQTVSQTRKAKTANYDYDEFSVFDFDTSLQGNQLGNLLDKTQGAVTYSSSYIYYSIVGSGIYKFEPNEEKNSKVLVDNYNFKYLNILGDYLYAVDMDSQSLLRIAVSNGDSMKIADGICFAYLYNDKIYYIGADNSVGYIDTAELQAVTLYTAPADKTLSFAGISLERVFVTAYDSVADYYEYITVAVNDKNDRKYFRDDTNGDEITKLYFECGFMYYYKKTGDSSFSLCRQKFGSENVVTLIENASVCDYPIVYNNRLYYAELDGSVFKGKELNMNSGSKKTVVSVKETDLSGTMAVGYGYQYVFLIGTKTNGGDNVCRASSIETSSSGDNTLKFSDGKLVY